MPDLPGQIWYDPQALLQTSTDATDEEKQFWLDAVGYQLGRSLYNRTDLSALSQPVYADMTAENVQTLGAPVIFNQWMFEYFWGKVRGGSI